MKAWPPHFGLPAKYKSCLLIQLLSTCKEDLGSVLRKMLNEETDQPHSHKNNPYNTMRHLRSGVFELEGGDVVRIDPAKYSSIHPDDDCLLWEWSFDIMML